MRRPTFADTTPEEVPADHNHSTGSAVDDGSDVDSLYVPDLVAHAPGPVRWLLERTYCPLLSEDDTPRERLLKSFVFVTLPLIAAPGCNMALTVLTGLLPGQSPAGMFTEAAGMALIIGAWGGIYGYTRATKRVSDWSADASNLATWVGIVVMTLSNLDANMSVAAMYGLLFVLIALTPRTLIFGLLYSLAFFLGAYNSVVADANRSGTNEWSLPLLAFPGAQDRGLAIRMLFSAVIFYVPLIPTAVGLGLRMASADALSQQALENGKLAAVISSALARYDTAAARAALETAQSSEGADGELLGHFDTLIANLDAYRPHLPNWVIEATNPTGDDDEDVGDDDSEPSIDMDELQMCQSVMSASGRDLTESPRSPVAPPSSGATAGRTPHTTTSRIRSSARLMSSITEVSSSAFNKSPSALIGSRSRSQDKLNRSGSGDCGPAASNLVAVDQPMVNVALLDIAPGGGPRPTAATFDRLVDAVHELARTSKGAVHSFVGDRVTVSWNAASRVANPQAKAARFLAEMAAKVASFGANGGGVDPAQVVRPPRVTGATGCGKAHVLVAGRGAQRALYVSPRGTWFGALEALRQQASLTGLMLCDERTWRDAGHAVKLRAAAAVVVTMVAAHPAQVQSATAIAPTGHSHLTDPDSDATRHHSTARHSDQQGLPAESVPSQPLPHSMVGTSPIAGPSTTPASSARTSEPVRVAGYAVLGAMDDGGDEWMYVLEGREAAAAEKQRAEELREWLFDGAREDAKLPDDLRPTLTLIMASDWRADSEPLP